MVRKLAKDVIGKLQDITKIEFSERSHQVEIIGKYDRKNVIVTMQIKEYIPRENYGEGGESVKGTRKRKIKNNDRQWVTIDEAVNRYNLSEAEKKFIYDAYVYKHLDQRQIHRVSGIPQPYIYRYIKHMKMTPVYAKTIRSERTREMTPEELLRFYNLDNGLANVEYADTKVKDRNQIPCVSAEDIEEKELVQIQHEPLNIKLKDAFVKEVLSKSIDNTTRSVMNTQKMITAVDMADKLEIYNQLYLKNTSLFEELSSDNTRADWFSNITKRVINAIHCYNSGRFGTMSVYSDECIYMVTDTLYTNFILDEIIGKEISYPIIPLCMKCMRYIENRNNPSTLTVTESLPIDDLQGSYEAIVPMPWRRISNRYNSEHSIEKIFFTIQDDFKGDTLNTIACNKYVDFTKPFNVDPYPTRSEWKARREALGLKNGENWRNSDISVNPGKKIQGDGKTAAKKKKAKNSRREERRKKNIQKFNQGQPTRYNVNEFKDSGYFDKQNKQNSQHTQDLKK